MPASPDRRPVPSGLIATSWRKLRRLILAAGRQGSKKKRMKLYAQWRDVKNSGPPSPLAARKNRTGYAQTHDYYVNNNGYSPKAIDSYLKSLGAGDWFSWF